MTIKNETKTTFPLIYLLYGTLNTEVTVEPVGNGSYHIYGSDNKEICTAYAESMEEVVRLFIENLKHEIADGVIEYVLNEGNCCEKEKRDVVG